MNKLFDLRFVIGSFFSITGLILLITGFSGKEVINLYCGGAFLLFGLLMLLFTFFKKGGV
jgi:hypothetical protein